MIGKWKGEETMNQPNVQRRPVLVVGAGPIGLTAALALRHFGLPATVIEAEPKDRLRPGSRAIYFHKATLQHLEDIFPGLGRTFAKHGV
ncbi:Coenzyme F390 Synthetase, partial [Geobacillus sp. WSUCF1]